MINKLCDFNVPKVGIIEIPSKIIRFLMTQTDILKFFVIDLKQLKCQIYDKIQDKLDLLIDGL